MALDFNDIKELAKKRIQEKKNLNVKKSLTKKEKESVTFYVGEIEKYILKYAEDGKQVFKYDCSNLEKHVFHELAKAFKEQNKLFFVMTNDGCQELTIDWTGKNEV